MRECLIGTGHSCGFSFNAWVCKTYMLQVILVGIESVQVRVSILVYYLIIV